MKCPHCHQFHPDSVRYCPFTGRRIAPSPWPVAAGVILLSILLVAGGTAVLNSGLFAPEPSNAARLLLDPTAAPEPDAPAAEPTSLPASQALETPTAFPPGSLDVQTAQTDVNGSAVFEDRLNGRRITARVSERGSNAPLPGINISFVSNGADLLVFASDPGRAYLPDIQQVAPLSARPGGVAPVSRLSAPPGQSVVLVFLLLKLVDLDEWLWKFWDAAQDPPRIERWGFFSADYCVTSRETAKLADLLADTALLAFPPFEKFFGKAGDDLLIEALKQIGDDQLKQLLEAEITKMGLSFKPSITRWRTYRIPGLPFTPAIPAGFCLEPLDQNDVQSVSAWMRYSLAHQELFVFETLAAPNDMFYANNPIEGGQTKPRTRFLAEIKDRLAAAPLCTGISRSDTSLLFWTSGWAPAWEMTQFCYASCQTLNPPYQSSAAGFFLYKMDSGWTINLTYLADPAEYRQTNRYSLESCEQPGLVLTPAPVSPTRAVTPAGPSRTACPGGLTTRLKPGLSAYVALIPPVSNRLRSGPGKSFEILDDIPPGGKVELLSGLECADGLTWWKVRVASSGKLGWTAESDAKEYWLTPCPASGPCQPR